MTSRPTDHRPLIAGHHVLLGARALQNVNGFLLTVLLARGFGLEAVGSLTVATVMIVAGSLAGTFGLPYVLAKLDMPAGQLNRIGGLAALLSLPLALPFIAGYAALVGHDLHESAVIAAFALAGPIFAQTNIAAALQVLQDRHWHTLVPPLANLGALAVAWVATDDLLAFALTVAAIRLAGSAVCFALLPGAAVPLRVFAGTIRRGAAYIGADAVNVAFEQGTVVVLSGVLSRADLGLVGLCRQFTTFTDTPGWSLMQARYPALVRDLPGAYPGFVREMMRLGALLSLGAAVAAVPLAILVFEAPAFALLGPLVMAGGPFRYWGMAMELKLRAAGETGAATRLSATKGVVGLLIVPAGGLVAGAAGAVGGMVLGAAAGALLAREAIRRSLPLPGRRLPESA